MNYPQAQDFNVEDYDDTILDLFGQPMLNASEPWMTAPYEFDPAMDSPMSGMGSGTSSHTSDMTYPTTGGTLQPSTSAQTAAIPGASQNAVNKDAAEAQEVTPYRRTTDYRLDRLLLSLKASDQKLSWKAIGEIVCASMGEKYTLSALQMRYQRLKKHYRPTKQPTPRDALMQAIDYWQTHKWQIVASKMADFGDGRRWSAEKCKELWLTLELENLRGTRKKSESEDAET